MGGLHRIHPMVMMFYFMETMIFGMCFMHPFCLVISAIGACLTYCCIRGYPNLQNVFRFLSVIILIAFINPLFNTKGETVLFHYCFGRVYTKEAFFYGLAQGLLFATVLVLFACFEFLFTSDKLTYLFGKMVPNLTMIITLTLRLLPSYQVQFRKIRDARTGIGKGNRQSGKKERWVVASEILSVMVTASLEGGMETADAMKGRGYGQGNRTSYQKYGWKRCDKFQLAFFVVLMSIILYEAGRGSFSVSYLPTFRFRRTTFSTYIGTIAYGALFLYPMLYSSLEEIKWHILRSKI